MNRRKGMAVMQIVAIAIALLVLFSALWIFMKAKGQAGTSVCAESVKLDKSYRDFDGDGIYNYPVAEDACPCDAARNEKRYFVKITANQACADARYRFVEATTRYELNRNDYTEAKYNSLRSACGASLPASEVTTPGKPQCWTAQSICVDQMARVIGCQVEQS